MTSRFHPQLVNGPFEDAALYVEFMFEKRAILFDLGDLHRLSARKILRISDVFISHTHLDHFIGFDQLLRFFLGRQKTIRFYGPEGLIERVTHKLSSYSWNLLSRYANDLILNVTEVISEEVAKQTSFRLSRQFAPDPVRSIALTDATLLAEDGFEVKTAIFEHRIPCLGFALEEREHINVWKSKLDEIGLPPGQWLNELKDSVRAGMPDATPFRIDWREGDDRQERMMTLGALKEHILRIVPGQKIAYVVDVAYTKSNVTAIVALAKNSRTLFIEATFSDEDENLALNRAHLTTTFAGKIARLARVSRVMPFHFSTRYLSSEAKMRREVDKAFRGR